MGDKNTDSDPTENTSGKITEDPVISDISKIESLLEHSTPLEKAGSLKIVTAIINGAGVGLLLGALLGLSISPVVSGVIATLSGLLAVLLGTSEKYMSPLKSVRIGAFGFFCVAGIFLGMYVRTNKGLLPARQKMMADYRAVGFTKEEALDFIAYREFGLIPTGWTGKPQMQDNDQSEAGTAEPETKIVQDGKSGTALAKTNLTSNVRQFLDHGQTGAELGNVLYSTEINASECYKLNIANSSQPVSEIINTFERAGGNWKKMAHNLDTGLPENIFILALFTMRDCLCQSGHSGKFNITMTEKIKNINTSQSLEEIRRILLDAGGIWTLIVEKISVEIPAGYQKTLYLSLIKILES